MENLHQLVQNRLNHISRRHFFRDLSQGLGLGMPALAAMLAGDGLNLSGSSATASEKKQRNPQGGLVGLPHHAPKAKRAIYLFLAGGPSQLDMFDYKPKLAAEYNKDLPESIRKGQRITTMTSKQSSLPIAPSIYKFKQHGQSGAWASELIPNIGSIADDISIIKTMHTEAINHDPAITYICTGNQIPGKASLGSWLSYGLGSENADLPGFVVLTSSWTGRKKAQALYSRLWGSGFLASKYQGVALRSGGDPVLYLSNPNGVSNKSRRLMIDAVNRMNQSHYESYKDPEIQARIAQYEMAFRMQHSVPELTDFSDEPKHILEMYGDEVTTPGTFAHHCLLSRRMAERGVRFTQIFHRGWDQHNVLPDALPRQCHDIDQPAAALVKDLKQRGMLDDTLVVCGGEFGRTVYCQGKLTPNDYGRDHHPRCFTTWLAGGGVKGGVVHGETDDYSYNILDEKNDAVHIHDLNATMLHLLGIDYQRLSVPFQGLDQRLTSVAKCKLVKSILA